MPVEGLKSLRVDFGGGRGDTVRVFKELLTDSLVVGETVWAVDDDGTERLAWVSAERGETYVLRVYPASACVFPAGSATLVLVFDHPPDVLAWQGQASLRYEEKPVEAGVQSFVVPPVLPRERPARFHPISA